MAVAQSDVDTIATTATLPALEQPLRAYPLPGGRLAVLDYKALHTLILDKVGSVVAALGRPGAVPGEFTMLTALVLRGDTVAGIDVANARLSSFIPGRGFVGTRPLQKGFAHQAFVLLAATQPSI